MAKWEVEFYVERDDEELVFEATGTYTSDPGRTYGPPENCYPPEEGFEYALSLNGVAWTGTLTPAEEDRLRMKVIDSLDSDWDPPDYDDLAD